MYWLAALDRSRYSKLPKQANKEQKLSCYMQQRSRTQNKNVYDLIDPGVPPQRYVRHPHVTFLIISGSKFNSTSNKVILIT